MRMIVANPNMKNPLESNAIILIDEIDLHLHPDWQSSIAKKLPEIFPNAQFIISSHSPSVMSVAKNLYKIDGKSNTFEKINNAYGRSPADILTQLLNVHREPVIAQKFRAMYDAIDRGDMVAARRHLDNILLLRDTMLANGLMQCFTVCMNLLGIEGDFHQDYKAPIDTERAKGIMADVMRSIGEL
jgi:hypothetical protein